MELLKSANEFMEWFLSAPSGGSVVYAETKSWGALRTKGEGNAVSTLIDRLAQEGKICLTQRAVGSPMTAPATRSFQYIATKRAEVGPPAWKFVNLKPSQAA